MRRGTPSSIFFGYLLFLIRKSQNKTMAQIAEKLGQATAIVSQIEKGQRALKEDRFDVWANALSMTEEDLRDLWWLAQGWVRLETGVRVFYTDYVDFQYRIMLIMRRYVCEPPIDVPKIEKEQDITRQRRKSTAPKNLDSLMKSLSSIERSRVQGYIEAIIDARPKRR